MSRTAVVVGAGVVGLSIANALVALDWKVRLVDQETADPFRPSSDAETRFIRWAHGPGVAYTQLATRSLTSWQALAADTGTTLFDPTGVAWIVDADATWLRESVAALATEGRESVVVGPAEARDWLPSVQLAPDECLLIEPQAGLLRARAGLRALRAKAATSGVDRVVGWAQPEGGSAIVDGHRLDADMTIWAVGPWLAEAFPDLVPAVATRQDVLHFRAPPQWVERPMMPWIDFGAGMYGAPGGGGSIKLASDAPGRHVAIAADGGVNRPDSERLSRAYFEHRFPGARLGEVIEWEVCHYGLTPDAQWVVSRHPRCASTWLVGGDSGHGFKHGPLLGQMVAEWADTGVDGPPEWSLDAREATTNRLRTAGGDRHDD